jgi:hypothetical protein
LQGRNQSNYFQLQLKIIAMHKNKQLYILHFILIMMASCFFKRAAAQQYDCNFKAPVINIDFGTGNPDKEVTAVRPPNYHKVNFVCPNDGDYVYATHTSDCFGGNWHTVPEDHTAGDADGRMMVVNASEEPGTFFINYISGLKPNTTYEFSVWFVNICLTGNCGTIYSPDISIDISSGDNKIAQFSTGVISPTTQPVWKKYTGIFTVPQGATVVAIKMDDNANGGCGNDFALDDILIKECRLPELPVTIQPAPLPAKPDEVKAEKKPVPVVKQPVPALANAKKSNADISSVPFAVNPAAPATVKTDNLSKVTVPTLIATRANPLIKKIETEATDMVVELYDNGEIDGDTVTIYHNNQLLVAHAGLAAKPITFKIKVDKEHPHHELVMVADNLGSIPPNTSLMVLTAAGKRYEIFISSTEQKNAKIAVDLKE